MVSKKRPFVKVVVSHGAPPLPEYTDSPTGHGKCPAGSRASYVGVPRTRGNGLGFVTVTIQPPSLRDDERSEMCVTRSGYTAVPSTPGYFGTVRSLRRCGPDRWRRGRPNRAGVPRGPSRCDSDAHGDAHQYHPEGKVRARLELVR